MALIYDENQMLEHPLCQGTCYRLVTRHQIQRDLANSMVRGMVQFLVLLSSQQGILSPPTLIDTAWHEALIDTSNYREFCSIYFDAVLDHHPPISENHNGSQNRELTRMTVNLARERFGQSLESLVWRRSKSVQALSRTS